MTTVRHRSIALLAAAILGTTACASSTPGDQGATTRDVTTSDDPTTASTSPTSGPTSSTPSASIESTSTPSTSTPSTTSSTTSTSTSTTEPAPRDPALLYLPIEPTIGDSAQQEVTSSSSTGIDAPGEADDVASTLDTQLTTNREVTSIDTDSYTVTETIVGGNFELGGDDADPATDALVSDAFDEIVGIVVETIIGSDGLERDRTVLGGDDLSELASNIITAPPPQFDFEFSPDGIAVGDTWTVTTSMADFGAPIDVTYTLELDMFDGNSYHISISIDQDVSDVFDGAAAADIRMTGNGTIEGETGNVLLNSSTLTIEMAGTLTDPDGGTGTISLITTTSAIATPL